MGSPFRDRLRHLNPAAGAGRRWVYVPYDQLTDEVGPLSERSPGELAIVLVESAAKAGRRPYHRQKLALVLATQRHFALEQAARGVHVRYLHDDRGVADALRDVVAEVGPLVVMRPAERELRAELKELFDDGRLVEVPHEGWLTDRALFEQAVGAEPPWLHDAFYRAVRREKGILMEAGDPVGGRFSFDADNRQPWNPAKGAPPAPGVPVFPVDEVKEEVASLIGSRFSAHPGRLDVAALPATRRDAETAWAWAREACLPSFGPYEDAMSSTSRTLFHTRISPLLNLHRLLPRTVVADALALDLPLASQEGFIRQVVGWREFVHHVHEATDGFRTLETPVLDAPGDGGWSRWTGRAWPAPTPPPGVDGGADPSAFGQDMPLPPAFWGRPSGLRCLDDVVAGVWDEGWSHHITRLMVLSNISTLLGVRPRELADWFWVAYVDAYDWVVEPNVLAMGTFGVGHVMTTKPYISGAAYLDRMSDYCRGCRFHPKKTCPLTPLYWGFLDRHREQLARSPRTLPMLRGSQGRGEPGRRLLPVVREVLLAGEELTPDLVASAVGEGAPRAGAPRAQARSRSSPSR